MEGISRVVTGVQNPYRSQVLSWYRKCLRAAFAVPWETDEDALYVLDETRRLFHQNRNIRDVDRIERKLREVEMRYELAVHYRIPYPRPFHKTQGTMQEGGMAYCAYMDSALDVASSPYTFRIDEGSFNSGYMGGSESSDYYYEDVIGTAAVEGRTNTFQTASNPRSTRPEG